MGKQPDHSSSYVGFALGCWARTNGLLQNKATPGCQDTKIVVSQVQSPFLLTYKYHDGGIR